MKVHELRTHLDESGAADDADVMFVVAEEDPQSPAYPCELRDVRFVADANVLELEVEAMG